MINRLFKNKKVLLIVLVIALVIVGIVVAMLFSKDSKKTDGKKPNAGIEQNADDEEYNGEGLQIQEDDDGVTEDRSDASGSWEDDTSNDNSDSQSGNESESGDKVEEETDDGNEDNSNHGEEENSDEDTLIDDKIWGDIF